MRNQNPACILFSNKKSNIIPISSKKENGLLDCPPIIKKKNQQNTLHTKASALENSIVKYNPLWVVQQSTTQQLTTWNEPQDNRDKKGDFNKKNAVIPMGLALGHLCKLPCQKYFELRNGYKW